MEVDAKEGNDGFTALEAAQNGHLPIVKLLHGRGANVNANNSDWVDKPSNMRL